MDLKAFYVVSGLAWVFFFAIWHAWGPMFFALMVHTGLFLSCIEKNDA